MMGRFSFMPGKQIIKKKNGDFKIGLMSIKMRFEVYQLILLK